MTKRMLLIGSMTVLLALSLHAQEKTRLVTDRSLELTGFQDPRPFTAAYDLRIDFVMVYGAHESRVPAIKSWVEQGYVPHLMTGIAWGDYQDFKDISGRDIMSLAQINAQGKERLHGPRVPYVVPSVEFADYITEKLKPLIDAGILAIHLEEPEFWADTGFSPAFAREWELYYHEPYVRADSSPDAQYKASRLKYYLYGRALRRVAEACKEYAHQKYGRELRIYVPTHSLINYTQWAIVSPQSSLIDSAVVDGCIAQVWTGTARTANVYQGRAAERTFETAFLEYGVMQELVRGTNRRMWFLADPIEDNPRYDWDDYRVNYKATLIASLLQPHIWHYEICPWPSRIFLGKYPAGSPDAKPIPAAYATTLCTVFNQLRDMNQPEIEWQDATHGVGVFMADSGMFQRAEPAYRLAARDGSDPTTAERKDIQHFSAFYGLTLPLLKHGVPVQPVQLDNVARFPNYLSDYKVLVLSYEFIKPETPAINQAVAEWVAQGGALVYVGADTDPFSTITDWWNTGKNRYDTPAQHLFSILGLDRKAAEGRYTFGKGHVFVQRKHPAYYSRSQEAANTYRTIIKQAAEAAALAYRENNFLKLRRGPYMIAACLRESVSEEPLELKGQFVDIYDPNLPVVSDVTLQPGQQTWLLDLDRLDANKAEPIASAARFETWKQTDNGVEFTLSAPTGIRIVSRIRVPKRPTSITIADQELTNYPWHEQSRTVFFESPKGVSRQHVKILW
ncbi:MAG: hypothetical protein KBI32_06475 [Phycisphaerae bacterium]|nr:hypothetical protein [Phycisphaerae bacterium]